MTRAAFQGSYSDLKFVKSRSVAQVTVEIPIEQAAAFVAAFGAPTPGAEIPVAIARLDLAKATSEAPRLAGEASETSMSMLARPIPKERRRFDTLPLSQQAAMRCNEVAFRRFVAEREKIEGIAVLDLEMAADAVREICGVKTRADISDDHPSGMRWRKLNAEFDTWMRIPA